MAVQVQGNGGTVMDVDSYLRSQRVSLVPRGASYSLSSITGTIAAALAANSTLFALRNSPSGAKTMYVTKLRLRWSTIVAFTVPVTAGRRLAIYRGSGAAAAGGTALATIAQKTTADAVSKAASAQGGDARIATTGALTVTGITFEAQELRTMAVAGFGAAGATVEDVYEFDAGGGSPMLLAPGELLGIRNPAAMDAAGTWQIDVDADWFEL